MGYLTMLMMSIMTLAVGLIVEILRRTDVVSDNFGNMGDYWGLPNYVHVYFIILGWIGIFYFTGKMLGIE